jgi:hypothetical protein
LAAFTGALTALKSLTGIAKDVNNIEINQKILELQQKLLDIQIDYGNLIDKNRVLKAEADDAKATLFHHSVYWKKHLDGTESGPFCPICFETKKLAMPLAFHGKPTQEPDMFIFECPVEHVGKGKGWQPSYLIPNTLIPEDRYQQRR